MDVGLNIFVNVSEAGLAPASMELEIDKPS